LLNSWTYIMTKFLLSHTWGSALLNFKLLKNSALLIFN